MSIQHRRRAVIDRAAESAASGKRESQPAEFERASAQPSLSHEREAASTRDLATQTPVAVPQAKAKAKAKAKKKAKR